MKIFILAIILFGLPHVEYIPNKLGILPEQIPLGFQNILLISALLLAIFCRSKPLDNPLKIYSVFIWVIVAGVFVSIINPFDMFSDVLTNSKRQLSLMLLYFLPLIVIRTEDEFKKIFFISSAIFIFIGFEVMSSGVLGGANFHDGKRGSGPFSEGLAGSDIAGSFLAQNIMFLFAFIFNKNTTKLTKTVMSVGILIMFSGLYATYARGALLGCFFGLFLLFFARGMKIKNILLCLVVMLGFVIFAPQSMTTRVGDTTSESGELDESSQGRFFMWKAATDIALKNPIGTGTGQIRQAMKQQINKHADPHNIFFYILCENSIIGLIVFILLIVSIIKYSYKYFSFDDIPDIYRTFSHGMIGFIGSFIVCNMFYANYFKFLVLGTVSVNFGMLAYIIAEVNQPLKDDSSL